MKFEGEFGYIIGEVNPEHNPILTIEHGKKVLYVRVLKAISCVVKSVLRCYEVYTMTLKDVGFKLNPYEKFVANNITNGS